MNLADTCSLAFWSNWWGTHGDSLLSAVIKIVVILVAYLVMRVLVVQLIGRVAWVSKFGDGVSEARQARLRALKTVMKSTIGFVLGFITIVMVLQAAGINIVPLITTASVAGLAIGFGAQKLVKDVISGFFILSEDQYGVGDYVTIGAVSGVVEELGMRTTRIRDNSGKLFIISNGDIIQLFNHSRGDLLAWVDVPVSPSADMERARNLLNAIGIDAANHMPDKIKAPFKCDGLAQIGGDKIVLRFSGAVVARYQDDVVFCLNEAVREAFARESIPLA